MTVGLRDLLAADEVWLVVTGGHKAAIVREALHGEVGPDVQHHHKS